jgi:transposase-like protein
VAGDAGRGDDCGIQREYFVKGKTIKEIARDMKVSRNTVRKVFRSGETSLVRTSGPAAAEAWSMDVGTRRTIRLP